MRGVEHEVVRDAGGVVEHCFVELGPVEVLKAVLFGSIWRSFLLLHVLLDEVLDVDVYARLCAVWASWPLGDGSRIDLRIVLKAIQLSASQASLPRLSQSGLPRSARGPPSTWGCSSRAAWWSNPHHNRAVVVGECLPYAARKRP